MLFCSLLGCVGPSCSLQFCAKLLEAAAEQIFLPAVVGIERRAANVRLVDNLLNGDGVVTLAQNQRNQRPMQRATRARGAAIHSSFHFPPRFSRTASRHP